MENSFTQTEKGKQHYIPKFYLRNFSHQFNKKQIGVFILANAFFYPTAALKYQAYKSFFYGKDGQIEDALSAIESISAILLENICRNSFVPKPNTKEHWDLLYFVLLSECRNPSTSKKIDNAFESFFDTPNEIDNEYKKAYDRLTDNKSETILAALKSLEELANYCDDLSFKILKNCTGTPFITSDNPVLPYNQFLESRRWHGNGSSLTSRGIEIFLALDPKTMVIFYDSWVYKVGDKKKKIIEINSDAEIDQLNLLHFLNCDKTIFFNHEVSEPYIKILFQNSKKFERANIVKTLRVPKSDHNGNIVPNSTLVITTFTECKTKLSLSFIKQKDQAKNHILDDRLVQPRPNYYKKKYAS